MVNSYLNLFARVVGKKIMGKMPERISFSQTSIYDELIAEINDMAQTTFELMDKLNFAEAVETIKQIVFKGNGILTANNFWTLVKGDQF